MKFDKILKYKYFESSEEFEKWQEENMDKIAITQITPVNSVLDFVHAEVEITQKKKEITGKSIMQHTIFVLYRMAIDE